MGLPAHRSLALAHAAGRTAIGTALTLQPRRASHLWIGRDSRRPTAQALAAALGVRDAAIGAGIIVALRRGEDPTPLIAGGVASDFVDLVATLRTADDLPAPAVAGIGALALGSTALGAWLYAAYRRSP